MEPGDKDIMNDRPRPKSQNIMLFWMFKFMLAKAVGCTVPNIIAYVWALDHYVGDLEYAKIADRVQVELDAFEKCADAHGRRMLGEKYVSALDAKVHEAQEAPSSWDAMFTSPEELSRQRTLRHVERQLSGATTGDEVFEECYDTEGTEAAVFRAQTAVFVGMVWSENVMGYVARSFDKPIWHNFLGNPAMQKATVFAECGLFIAALLLPAVWFPARKYFLSLNALDIGAMGWLFAFIGAGGCVLLCELYKLYARKDIKAFLDSQKAEMKLHEQERLRQSMAAVSHKSGPLDMKTRTGGGNPNEGSDGQNADIEAGKA
jgi:hypothetical protein